MNDFKGMLALYQNPIAFGILECSAGVSLASAYHSFSGETPDLHKCLGKSKEAQALMKSQGPGSWEDAPL